MWKQYICHHETLMWLLFLVIYLVYDCNLGVVYVCALSVRWLRRMRMSVYAELRKSVGMSGSV